MRIGVTGASGFIGRAIVAQAKSAGDQVIAFSRSPERKVPDTLETQPFLDPDVSDVDAVIQLAGESILGLWTSQKKRLIVESRVRAIRAIVESIKKSAKRPGALLVASGVGIYSDRGNDVLPESARVGDHGFLRDVALAVEREAATAAVLGVRVVNVRIAMVLGPRAGAVAAMSPMFRLGLGGHLGSGKQWMSWIHVSDAAGLFLEAARNPQWSGPINGSAPNPVRNREFTDTFASLLHKPALIPVPALLLKSLLREESSLVLDSQRVIPEKALQTGFVFRYPFVREALANALEISDVG